MKECPACRRCFSDEVIHCPQDGDATTPSLLGEPILDARYQLERRLGQGGMGVVFQARHIFLKTSHAIKVILPDLVGNDPMLVTRFRQEALAAAAIRHQNIIAVTDFGVVRGTMPFLVMEFVSGQSLQDIWRKKGDVAGAGPGIRVRIERGSERRTSKHRASRPEAAEHHDAAGPVGCRRPENTDFGLAKIKSVNCCPFAGQDQRLMGSSLYGAGAMVG